MPASSHSQLILDEIRQTALPQRLSLHLSWAHAGAAERLARGESAADVIQHLVQALDVALEPKRCVALVDVGDGLTAVGSTGIETEAAGTILTSLNQGPAFESTHPITVLAAPPNWWSLWFPEEPPQSYTCFRIGASAALIVASANSSRLTADETAAIKVLVSSVAFAAANTSTTPLSNNSRLASLACHPAVSECQGDALILVNPSGEIVEANLAAAQLLGIDTDGLSGKELAQFSATVATAEMLRAYPEAIEEAKPLHLRFKQGANGETVSATGTIKSLSNLSDFPELQGFKLLIARDASGERKLQDRLTQSSERVKAATASPHLLLLEIDRRGAIQTAQGGALAASGIQSTELEGRNAWAFCTDKPLRRALWRSLRREGCAQAELETPHGPFSVSLSATPGPNGRPQSIHGIAVRTPAPAQSLATPAPAPSPATTSPAPITKSQSASTPPIPHWLGALRATSEGVVLVDDNGLLRFMNPAAEGLFNRRFADVEGQPVDVFGSFGELDPLNDFLSDPGSPEALHQVTLTRHDGATLKLELASAAIDGTLRPETSPELGQIWCCRHEGSDQSQSQSMEMAAEIQRLEEENFKALSTFAGGIAHDFNNILTSLVGNVSLANMLVTEIPEASDRLVEAERACFRAKDLSHQLLTFAKGSTPIKKDTRLEDLIQQCAEFYLRGSKALPQITTDQSLWSVDIDEGQISQVLENLILNADHSMPHGGMVSISSENVQYAPLTEDHADFPLEPGLYVKVSIKDQGPGMPEEQISNIFKPYHTANESGRGLGLATTFTIIRNHGGHIVAESKKGHGTTFTFYLPATGKTKGVEHEPLELDPDRDGDPDSGRVLVIDDEKSIRDLATTTLELMGCDVVTCASSSDGVQRYIKESQQGTPFDLIIMDLTIPGDMGGNEAMQQILNVAPEARGIASSGYSEGSVMAHYREYGFQAALSKPYNIGDLQRMVSNMLSN